MTGLLIVAGAATILWTAAILMARELREAGQLR